MVGATRGTQSGFAASGSGTPPPPPPPPGFAEVLAAQTEFLRQIVQGQQAQQRHRGGNNAHPPAEVAYPDFLGTQPPLFNKAEEPLVADAWIRTIESMFSLLIVPCFEASTAHFAAQQLRGSSCLWWDHYHGMLLADHVVN